MTDDVARAVGAGSSETVTIAGKECRPRPLSIKELTELERDCLSRYRRQYLQTFSENLDLLPDDQKDSLMCNKIEEAARWDVDDLPAKWAYDEKRIRLNDSLRSFMKDRLDVTEDDDGRLRKIVAACLDQGLLDESDYVSLTGDKPIKAKVGYVNWWITGSFDGMVSMVWICFRDSGVTRDQVAEEMSRNPEVLACISREIESLSAPKVGNG